MKLDNNYTIEKDTYNFILKFVGEPYEKEVKGEMKTFTPKEEFYYPNLMSALKAFIEKSIDIDGIENVKELVNKLDQVYLDIENILKK